MYVDLHPIFQLNQRLKEQPPLLACRLVLIHTATICLHSTYTRQDGQGFIHSGTAGGFHLRPR